VEIDKAADGREVTRKGENDVAAGVSQAERPPAACR
jgi:hypothetical protein